MNNQLKARTFSLFVIFSMFFSMLEMPARGAQAADSPPEGDPSVNTVAATIGLDFGDAPAIYQTLLANNGPSHVVGSPVQLGMIEDAEPDGQPTPLADGDDLNPPIGIDDEDGVTFPAPLVAGNPAVPVLVTNGGALPGWLDAWIDFNGNKAFDHPGEHLWAGASQMVPPGGLIPLPFAIPANAVPGPTYARFRLSINGFLLPFGPAGDGEVEDYQVVIEGVSEPMDYGDAPDSYQTLLASDGARHVSGLPVWMGATVDAEADGQPSPSADGDDLNPATGADDEDGVSFPVPLVAGIPAALVQVDGGPSGGMLDAWIDFNANGAFEHPAEHLWAGVSQALLGGPNVLAFAVPANAVPGPTYARFRLSINGGLPPFGLASEGEVEDYHVVIEPAPEPMDYGDAPDSYKTLLASNGARHLPGLPLWMGATVDAEADGQPSPLADGDDLNPPPGLDDEDGVIFPAPLAAGNPAVPVQVVNGGAMPGLLDAWIDFNANGAFEHPGEHLWAGVSQPVPPGAPMVLLFAVPANAVPGPTYARFRLSINGGLPPFGLASDGEVEDYHVVIEPAPEPMDYGDAPDSYMTLLASNGARHVVVQGINLGPLVDLEKDGQPSPLADGDDLNPTSGPDDEDGVTLPAALTAGRNESVTVNGGPSGGMLDAWIDFNGNGVFDHPAELLWGGSVVISAGASLPMWFAVPPAATGGAGGWTYARFRLSKAGNLPPAGMAPDGEVEDYRVRIIPLTFTLDYAAGLGGSLTGATHQVVGYGGSGTAVTPVPDPGYHFVDWSDGKTDNPRTDINVTANVNVTANFAVDPLEGDYGDAPDSYKTLLASNGARHVVIPGINLGPFVDLEKDGQPSPLADGDDLNPPPGPNDEDGVALLPPFLNPGDPAAQLKVDGGPSGGMLDAWIDFNRNGSFEHPKEHLWAGVSQVLVPGAQPLAFAVPANAVLGPTYARFRLSVKGGLPPVGFAPDGEVEDYRFHIGPPSFTLRLTKTGTGTGTVTSDDGGINCGPDCSEIYVYGTSVKLTGTPTDNYNRLIGWSGTGISCPGRDPCTVSMTADITVTAEFEKATFADVPFDYPRWAHIQALWDGGYTKGCQTDPLKFCPENTLTRAESAVFMLRGLKGTGYTPPTDPAGYVFDNDDWTPETVSWARPWAEGMWDEKMTAGCQADPLKFCPAATLTRAEGSVFGERIKNGMSYTPPDAEHIFADDWSPPTVSWAEPWAEAAYNDKLLLECETSPLKFCPADPLSRSWAAYIIAIAKGLTLPEP